MPEMKICAQQLLTHFNMLIDGESRLWCELWSVYLCTYLA